MIDIKKFVMVCPVSYTNKVAAIKAIRTLTGLGLKEAKDASERGGPQEYEINPSIFTNYANPVAEIENQYRILRNEGVQVGGSVHLLLAELRDLAREALKQGEDELADEILQLVLAEKLRRNTI